MNAFFAIGWAILLPLSMFAVFELIGMNGLVRMFPEGRRWWQFPAQLTALAVFAAIVINHPF